MPVISAVGHETDFTIADLAADMRAPTPSAAAELAAPSIEQLVEKLNILERRMKNAAQTAADRASDRLTALCGRLAAQSQENRLKINAERLRGLQKRNELAFNKYISGRDAELNRNIAKLDSLSPLKVLSRGYSLVYHGDSLINSSAELKTGDKIRIRFGNGEADAEITDKR